VPHRPCPTAAAGRGGWCVQRRLNVIAEAHKAVGLESPTHHPIVANTMKGIRRTLGTAAAQRAAALTDDIRAMLGSNGRQHHRRKGPGANAARVCGCVQALGADRP
jgi:hypothetical protein